MLKALKEEVEYTFANALRRHERGDSLTVEQVLQQADTLLSKLRQASAPQIAEYALRDLLRDYWEHIAARKHCVPTGIKGLNDALGGGLEAQRLLVELGAPGVGKTALANQVADHVANAGRPVLYVTSEDSPFTLLAKTLARVGDINYTAVLKGWESERAKINAAIAVQAERTSSGTLRYVDASQGLSLDAMKELARAHFARYANAGQGLLVVDYLQRFARAQRDLLAAGRDLREVVTVLTESLRSIACELDCCVLALASQNRASGYGAGNGASSLASAKESGDIEYTADVIMALVEDKDRKPGASMLKPRLLRLDKNRQGDTTTLQLDWQGDRQRFTEAIK
jgi:replicative DNA helicase